MTHDSGRREAALDWLVRTNDPEFDRWDEFTAWLEESPVNADADHRLAESEADLLASNACCRWSKHPLSSRSAGATRNAAAGRWLQGLPSWPPRPLPSSRRG